MFAGANSVPDPDNAEFGLWETVVLSNLAFDNFFYIQN